MSDANVQLRNMLLAGAMAGLVGGAIVGGAVVVTSGPTEVYGTVSVDNLDTVSNQPDGSSQSPFHVISDGVVWTKSCSEPASSSFSPPQGC